MGCGASFQQGKQPDPRYSFHQDYEYTNYQYPTLHNEKTTPAYQKEAPKIPISRVQPPQKKQNNQSNKVAIKNQKKESPKIPISNVEHQKQINIFKIQKKEESKIPISNVQPQQHKNQINNLLIQLKKQEEHDISILVSKISSNEDDQERNPLIQIEKNEAVNILMQNVQSHRSQWNWTNSLSIQIQQMMATKNIKTTDNDYFNLSQANQRLSQDDISSMATSASEEVYKRKEDGKYEVILTGKKGFGIGYGRIQLMRPNQTSYVDRWQGETICWSEAVIKKDSKIIFQGRIFHRMTCMNPFKEELCQAKICIQVGNFSEGTFGIHFHNHPVSLCTPQQAENARCCSYYCNKNRTPKYKCLYCEDEKRFFICEFCFQISKLPIGDQL